MPLFRLLAKILLLARLLLQQAGMHNTSLFSSVRIRLMHSLGEQLLREAHPFLLLCERSTFQSSRVQHAGPIIAFLKLLIE